VTSDYRANDELHPGQKEVTLAVLAARDTLAVMPTSSSMPPLWETVALMRPDTVVITPHPPTQRHGRATADTPRFLSPEQLRQEQTLQWLQQVRPSLVVVAEAHSVSRWGHDFRPDYLRLVPVLETLGHPTVLALTTTASPRVRDEIVARLGMRNPVVIVRGFDRPNLMLAVQRHVDAAAKLRAITYDVAHADPPGIVYVATRRHGIELAQHLAAAGQPTGLYHPGISQTQRDLTLRAFQAGQIDIMVATNAFAPALVKSDVRFVYHFDVSDSLDSYFQEICCAGRDGRPADAVLFYRPADLGLHRFFAAGGQVAPDDIRRVAEAIQAAHQPVKPRDLPGLLDMSTTKRHAAIHGLQQIGAIEVLATGELTPLARDVDAAEAATHAASMREDLQRHELSRIEMMQAYAETSECRRKYLLNYFGEHFNAPCLACDNCRCSAKTPAHTSDDNDLCASRPFPEKSFVVHQRWGKGIVVRYDRQKIVILFDEAGRKTFQLPALMQAGLLHEVSG
jgi:ATP-dependent DNA helicase RecQ